LPLEDTFQQAFIELVCTHAPPQDILSEVCDKESATRRPKPQNKRVRAILDGKADAIEWAAAEVARRDPDRRKRRVCLMDGAIALWKIALVTLQGLYFCARSVSPESLTFISVGVYVTKEQAERASPSVKMRKHAMFHVLEYLWRAAHVFHREGSAEAESFVQARLKMLLEGKVGYLIGGLRQMLSKHSPALNASQRKTLKTVIGYYERHRSWMRYDQYIGGWVIPLVWAP